MSEKSTAAKLQIKDGYAVWFSGREDAAALVGELPTGAHPSAAVGADAAVLFVADRAELDARILELATLTAAKAVWVCYPKGNATDINRDSIRGRLQQSHWEVVTNVSIDATWSALRAKFVSAL